MVETLVEVHNLTETELPDATGRNIRIDNVFKKVFRKGFRKPFIEKDFLTVVDYSGCSI